MKPLLTGACAVALGSLAYAGTEPASDWLGLDQELNALSSNVNTQGNGPSIQALVRAAYINASKDDFAGFGGNDQLGLVIDEVELGLEGQVGDYFWRVGVDFGQANSPYYIGNLVGASTLANTPASDRLEDAYTRLPLGDQFSVQIGHFVFPMTFSSDVDSGNLILPARTTLGEYFHNYDLGAMFSGDYDQLSWHVAAMNGSDGTADEQKLAARVVFDFGAGALDHEGALGANEDLNASVGVTYCDDGAIDNSTILGFDAMATVGDFSFGAEYASFDDGHAAAGFGASTGLNYTDGMSVWALTVGFLLNEQFEIAGRFETLDDVDDTTVTTLGVNYYQVEHMAKWHLAYMDFASDVAGNEGTLISLGVTVGAGR
ncbi:MAG: hypothetical protein R3F34_03165 [Planctomycetota bacterium]